MSETTVAGEVLNRLWYYGDALSSLSFERIEDVATASAPIVRSVLQYQSAVVALRRDNDILATATAVAPRTGVHAGELNDVVNLSQRLLESVEDTGVVDTSTLDHGLQQVIHRLQLGKAPCVAPIRIAVKNVPQSIGIVVIGGPPRRSDPKTDLLVLNLIASLIGGATSSTIARMDLRRINRHLEETVAQRTQELANAIQVANSANHAKSAFLANMSHEIRTPMTAILGFAEMLDEMVTTSQQSDAVNTIQRNGEHLLEVINDILDISKIEAGKVKIERILLSPFQLITEVESLMDIRASAGGLSLKVEYDGPIPERINSDPTRPACGRF
jgi:signal transduction histidine kinase